MILFIGDLDCRYWLVNNIIDAAEKRFKKDVTTVIQLGDFGLYKKPLKIWFNRPGSRPFKRPLNFIDGNHEDFLYFEILVQSFNNHFTYLERGSVNRLDGFNFLCLGGSSYMDPVNTPPGAVILDTDIEACLAHNPEDVDIIITHDCPSGIGVPGTPGFEYCGPTGFENSRLIREKFSSKPWLFAHHHRFFEYTDSYGTYFGLPEAHNGFAVMDDPGKITLVEHRIKI
ncbi:MAG: metallophosphoesterase [Deltaproteobacteria bacterium]|nr:metallophosphoesterase [Deltaproteobacteria bacterium]